MHEPFQRVKHLSDIESLQEGQLFVAVAVCHGICKPASRAALAPQSAHNMLIQARTKPHAAQFLRTVYTVLCSVQVTLDYSYLASCPSRTNDTTLLSGIWRRSAAGRFIRPGMRVLVFSSSLQRWRKGYVLGVADDFLRVEYQREGRPQQKTLHIDSDSLEIHRDEKDGFLSVPGPTVTQSLRSLTFSDSISQHHLLEVLSL